MYAQDLSGGLGGFDEDVKVGLGRVLRRLGKLGLVSSGASPEMLKPFSLQQFVKEKQNP